MMLELKPAPAAAKAVAVLFAFLLAGCQTLPERLEEDLKMAQDLVRKCDAIDKAFSMPTSDRIGVELKVRLRLKLTGVACTPYTTGGTVPRCELGDSRLDLDPLSRAIDQLLTDLSKPELGVAEETKKLRQASANIAATVGQILAAIDKIDEKKINISEECESAGLRCGRAIAEALSGLNKVFPRDLPFDAITRELNRIADLIPELEKKIPEATATMHADLRATVKAGRAAITGLRDLVVRGRATFGEALRVAGLVFAVDTEAVFDELFIHKLKYRAADRMLSFSENQLARFDKAVDKADDKLLMAGSFSLWIWQKEIQTVFDEVVKLAAKDSLDKLDFTLAFGRAGCDHLAKSPPPPAMFAPFLNRAIVKMAAVAICERKGGDEQSRKDCEKRLIDVGECREKGGTETGKVGEKAGCNFLAELREGQTREPVALNPMKRFQACYASKVAALAGELSSPQDGSSDSGRADAAARACGGFVENAELKDEVRKKAGVMAAADGPKTDVLDGMKQGSLLQIMKSQASYSNVTFRTVNIVNNYPSVSAPQSPPPAVTPPSACRTFERRVTGSVCRELDGGGYRLEIPGLYGEGEFQGDLVYSKLIQVGGAVEELSGKFRVGIGGTHSSSKSTCESIRRRVDRSGQPEAKRIAAKCDSGMDANAILAELRAASAVTLLRQRKPDGMVSVESLAVQAKPAPFVAAIDRGLIVELRR